MGLPLNRIVVTGLPRSSTLFSLYRHIHTRRPPLDMRGSHLLLVFRDFTLNDGNKVNEAFFVTSSDINTL
jgi:hypothetical protein